MRTRGRRSRRLWQRSWILTLPVVLAAGLWLRGTLDRWGDFTVRHNTSQDLSLLAVGQLEKDHMLRTAELAATAWRTGERLASTGLDTIHLYATDGALQRLDSNLPHSGFEYVEGGMLYDGVVQEVDLRYRGDNVYHWGFWKKSWRVKTKRGALYKGLRKFNLVAPRTAGLLNNYLSYRLAAHMGLIAPQAEVVNVALNGEYLGVFILTEQLEESTIRRHGRMPGDVYSGELVGRDSYQGIENLLFDHPGVWTKAAVNNHFAEEALDPLERLVRVIEDARDEAGQRALSELVDLEAFGRFSAFESLACCVHTDALHNWRLYYDPWETCFVPIVWDPVGWHPLALWGRAGASKDRPDVMTSPFHAALFRNAEFLRARSRAFAEFFEGGIDGAFLTETRELVNRLGPALALDGHLVTEVELVSPDEVEAALAELVVSIETTFEQVREIQTVDAGAQVRFRAGAPGRLELEVGGRRPVEQLELSYSGPVTSPLTGSLRWENASGPRSSDVTELLSVSGNRVLVDVALLARHQPSIVTMDPSFAHENGLVMRPARYELILTTRAAPLADGDPPAALGGELVGVRYRRTGSDRWDPAQPAEEIAGLDHGPMELVAGDARGAAAALMSGEIVVEGDRIFEGDVVVEAGTTLRLGPGANLLFRGRVLARGTAERPISFVPLEGGQDPWGVVAIKGAGANGSRFSHCRFREGSGWKQPLAEYSAMFSIHGVRDVVVEDCTFQDSRVVDDMVHGVYSSVVFRRCVFRRSLADALDMDISEVEVAGCLFDGSGNDAVDLMTTTATVSDTRFIESGDKGISVGEDSQLVVSNSLFDGCLRAIESKDKSIAIIVNSDVFDSGEIGVNAYNKNWRYGGGGTAHVHKCRFAGNDVALRADRRSRITIGDSSVDELGEIDARRITVEPTVDQGAPAANPEDLALVERLTDMTPVGGDLIRSMDGARRGSSLSREP
ncbi:MAG: CotH kinase family protein [Planctomycetota bacterium]|nr:CotH kinase family protein [Planctomycetota bacterium]